AGTLCWRSSNLGGQINSWNLAGLTVNGVNFANTFAFTTALPPRAADGFWYVSYTGNFPWSHFEATGTGTVAPTPTRTNTPVGPSPTPPRTATAGPSPTPSRTPTRTNTPINTPTRTNTPGAPTVTPSRTPTPPPVGSHLDNASVGATFYRNVDYVASVNAAADLAGGTLGARMRQVASFPTLVGV